MAAASPHTSTLVCGKQFQQLEYQAMQIFFCCLSDPRAMPAIDIGSKEIKSRLHTQPQRRSVWRFNDISGEQQQQQKQQQQRQRQPQAAPPPAAPLSTPI